MQFIEFADSSYVHQPAQGMHTMVVMIQEGLGFPLITSDSHKDTVASVSSESMKKIHQNKESVIMFNAGIACKYLTVKGTEDCAIMILY